MRPTPRGRAICFTQCADSNLSLIQKHPHRHTQKCYLTYLDVQSPSHDPPFPFFFFFSFPVLVSTFIVSGFPQICGDPWCSIHILKWRAKKLLRTFEHQGELTVWASLYGNPPVALRNPHFYIFRSLQKVSSSMCLQDTVLAIHGLGAKPAKSGEVLSPRHVSFLSVHCANL